MTTPPSAAKIASAAAKIIRAQAALFRLSLDSQQRTRVKLMNIHKLLGRALQDLAGEQ